MTGFSSKKQMAADRWVVEIQEDPTTGDGILEFPPELLESTGWKEGDELLWEKAAGQSWTIRKKP